MVYNVQLLDCYMEAYQHVINHEERSDLANIMYSVMKKRPRFDFEADYFLKSYRMESLCLRMQAKLVKEVMDAQVRHQTLISSNLLLNNIAAYIIGSRNSCDKVLPQKYFFDWRCVHPIVGGVSIQLLEACPSNDWRHGCPIVVGVSTQ